jgi:eukaryotic-like serine/threonine-protein kinase
VSEALDAVFVGFQQALAGRYSLERELGRGGMGIVYLAREVRLDRLVAIKLLPPHLAAHPPLRERFLREARTAARLSQPNIVQIFSVDEVGGFVFFVMAYVNGETLAHRVATRGPLAPAEATRILREVAWALAYAHAQGVVHRDVKPENILLEQGMDRALVADFGIARLAHASGKTGVGEVMGTPEFMSPEQIAGEAVDGRSDLYSLGAVGYYALSGRLPFDGGSAAATMVQHLTRHPPAVLAVAPAVPRPVAQAIDRCLAKLPGERFATGEALAEALGDAMEIRRETPVAVRSFVNRARGSLALFGGFYLGILPALTSHLSHLLAAGAAWTSYPILFLSGATAIVVLVPPGFALRQMRRLLAHGYGPDDVAQGLRLTAERRHEEYRFEHGPQATMVERATRVVSVAAFGVAGLTTAGLLTGQLPQLLWGIPLVAGYIGLISGVRWMVGAWRRAGKGSFWGRIWGGPVGRWLFRVGGIGLRRGMMVAVGRPTELALGSAADALFDALPKEIRRALGDLPGTIRGLEAHAQRIRKEIEGFDRAQVDAGQGPRPSTAQSRRDDVIADLRAARESAGLRLSAVVGALETIRLDLLRLRAGTGSLESVTADLTAAREVGDRTDLLLQGEGEVTALLEKGAS